jgi:hypothetical protein
LETRVNIAEQKITPTAIVSTVRQSTAYQDDLDGKISKNNIISEINQTAEQIKIQANRIKFEGLVTANSNFKILTDGSIEAKNADISGKITATSGSISDWTLDTSIYAQNGDTYTTLKSGGDVAFAAGSSSPNDTTGAALQIFHDGRLRANKDGVRRVELNFDNLSFYTPTNAKAGEIIAITNPDVAWPGINIRANRDNVVRLESGPSLGFQASINMLGSNAEDEPAMISMRTGSHAQVSWMQMDSYGIGFYSSTDSFKYYAGGVFDIMHRGLIQSGRVNITPTPNSPTTVRVYYPAEFKRNPDVVATGHTSVPGSQLLEVAVNGRDLSWVDLCIYRTTNTTTSVYWIAMDGG